MQTNELDRARDALHSIPPDLDRASWVRALMAAHAAGIPADDVEQWSAGADSYKASDFRSVWKSIKPGKGVGAGTLFKMAVELGGWRMDGKPQQRPAQAPRKAAEPPRKPAPGKSPAEVWERCQQATDNHPYIVKKQAFGVSLDGLRVLTAGDAFFQSGEHWDGALVVPAYADGTLSGLQLIAPPELAARLEAAGKKSKQNLFGSVMAGASFTVGRVTPGATIHIVEGIATAWACYQSTWAVSVCCFGWHNIARVTAQLRERDPTARLVLVPDVGKESDAEKIAREHHCFVARMPEREPNNFDASDLAQRDGHDVLEMLLQSASEPEPPPRLLKPVSVFDVLTNPALPPAFVWDGYLPRGVVALFGAHGGTGKSTFALMLGVCAALGRPLFGVDTVACNAVFASFEDGTDIVRHRLAGICKTWGINPADLDGKLHIVDGTANPELFSADNRSAGDTTATYAELCKLVQSTDARLVVVDNASDSFGGDEINRRQVRAFMRALTQVARLTNCAALLLAHVDKNTSRNGKAVGGEGYSGSTAWHNSARSRLFMSRAESGLLTLEHQKSNFGKMREPLTLTWPDNGLPMLASDAPDITGLTSSMQGRADDTAAAALLRLIAEFEGREQYCSPMATARNNVFSMLRSDPAFQALKLRSDDCKRIVTQCQRAKWLVPQEYRSIDRKDRQRWVLTPKGKTFAGLSAPTAPTCAHMDDGAQGYEGAIGGAPTAPTYAGGVGEEERTDDGATLAKEAAHE